MRKSKKSAGWQNLLAIAGRLKFQPHRITHLLDEKGRHDLKLPEGFPFVISLFHFRGRAITQRLTWHQRLELLVPLDGPMSERMGDRVVELQPGDVLVVDHLKPLFDHVREHYATRVSLETAARMCGMSKAQFGRTFKQASGMTLGNYLNQVRMKHAVELLEGTRDTISEIAFRLGFSDQSHFDRRFRRTFGRTPSQHRSGLWRRGTE